MQTQADIIIIGGGVIGLTTAYMLACRGACVTILERGAVGQEASWAGAGILPPGDSAKATSTMDRFRSRSVELYPKLSADLLDETGIDNEYHICGGVEFMDIRESPRVATWIRQGIAVISGMAPQHSAIVPPVRTVPYTLPGYAQVRNPRHLKALHAACLQRGVSIIERTTVAKLERDHRGHILAVQSTNATKFHANTFVLAAGAWSGQEFASSLSVQPILGVMLLYLSPRPLLTEILLVGQRYVVPRRDGHILVGSTEELSANFSKEIAPGKVRELQTFAEALVPALRDTPLVRTWAGLRPGTADGLPYIGRVSEDANLIVATGHYRSGLQLSPGTAELVTTIVMNKPVFDPDFLGTFAVDRIPNMTYERTFHS